MNILFLGNSFTFYNEMPEVFSALAKENGKDVAVFSVTKGGRKLYENLDNDDVYTKRFMGAIKRRKYGFVFLQDQSFEPIVAPLRFHDSVKRLCLLLKDKTEKIALYETWGYDKRCEKLAEHGWNDTDMPQMLFAEYKKAAKENNVLLSPAGEYFYEIYKEGKINLYATDFKHPSYEGSMLALLTHYYTVFGELPERVKSLNLDTETLERFKTAVLKGENKK